MHAEIERNLSKLPNNHQAHKVHQTWLENFKSKTDHYRLFKDEVIPKPDRKMINKLLKDHLNYLRSFEI